MARRPVPADLENALAASPSARDAFWSLPPNQLDRWVSYVRRSRFPGQRRRRIVRTVERLGGDPDAVALPRDTWLVWLLGLVVLGALAGFLVWWLVYRHHTKHTATSAVVVTAKSTVPKLTGIKLEAAEFQLKEAKLGVKVVKRTAKKPKNIVLGQAPRARAKVVQGTVVTLVASKGQPGAKVPKLTGLAAADAVDQLQKLGLTAELQQTAAAGAAPGSVVQQSPSPGKRLKRGAAVSLAVAKGAAAVVVPNVVGKAQQDAENDLQQRGLNVNAVTVASSQPAGTVVAQSPPASSKVQQGASVRVNVAGSTPQTTQATTTARTSTATPTTTSAQQSPTGNDYRGMRLGAAVQKIAQGRQQVVVQYVTSSQPAGVVVANSSVGGKVRLQVSSGASPQPSTSVPDETGQDEQSARDDLASAGFSVISVQWPVSDASNDGVVVAQTPTGRAPDGATVVLYVGSAQG
jgi:beta-lactam-binding protein with PASTA domain